MAQATTSAEDNAGEIQATLTSVRSPEDDGSEAQSVHAAAYGLEQEQAQETADFTELSVAASRVRELKLARQVPLNASICWLFTI